MCNMFLHLFLMLLKFDAVLSIICGFLMAISTLFHLLQCIVVVWSFLRMLKLRKLAVHKLYLSRGCRTQCQGVLEHGLNLHRNIPLIILLQCNIPLGLIVFVWMPHNTHTNIVADQVHPLMAAALPAGSGAPCRTPVSGFNVVADQCGFLGG